MEEEGASGGIDYVEEDEATNREMIRRKRELLMEYIMWKRKRLQMG